MSEMNPPDENVPEKKADVTQVLPSSASPPPFMTTQPASPTEPAEAAGGAPPVLTIIAFLVLLAGLVWLWRQDAGLHRRLDQLQAEQAAAQPVDPARVAALETGLESLRQQVAAPVRPAAPPVDMVPIEKRLAALEKRPLPSPAPNLDTLWLAIGALQQRPLPPSPPDLKPLETRIAALEQRPLPTPPPDLKPLETRIAALEKRPLPPPPADLKPVEARITALENKPAIKPEDPVMNARVASLAAAQQATAQQAAAAAAAAQASASHAARLQAVQQAQAALQQGKPLGSLADAPPALTQFASAPPPTEAALRLSFPAAAHDAAKASEPSVQGLSVLGRMWQRAQTLVTVRQGDHVLVGAPASTTLAAARLRLEAGDLAGALAALDKLDPRAAQAMAGWRAQAQSLLDARAALATMAAG